LTLPDALPIFGPLLDAIGSRQAVTFTYRAASTGEESRRRVQPWRLLSRDRGWYLVGHDVDRDAPRVFRLSRVVGAVRPTGPTGAFEVPEHDPQELLALRSEERRVGKEGSTPPSTDEEYKPAE